MVELKDLGLTEEEFAEAEDDFPLFLYGTYFSFHGGDLSYEEFIKLQLAIDLIDEFSTADRETKIEIIDDIHTMYDKDDFEAGEDDSVGDEIELPDGTKLKRIT